jgi:beta-lactam-binding protein with PASTA domain
MQPSPPNTNPAWSADGFNGWSADGYYGWTADGYEPTTLTAAVAGLAAVGVNVGVITLAFDPVVPIGYVITGWPALLSSAPGSFVPLTVSDGPAPVPVILTVPDVVGKFYYEAQLALLQAGFLIALPTWSLSTTETIFGWSADGAPYPQWSADGSGGWSADGAYPSPITATPQYVLSQSIAPGTQFTQQTQVSIVVCGFPVINQPNTVVPVP